MNDYTILMNPTDPQTMNVEDEFTVMINADCAANLEIRRMFFDGKTISESVVMRIESLPIETLIHHSAIPIRWFNANDSKTIRAGAIMVAVVILLPVLLILAAMAIKLACIRIVNTQAQIVTAASTRTDGRTFAETGDEAVALQLLHRGESPPVTPERLERDGHRSDQHHRRRNQNRGSGHPMYRRRSTLGLLRSNSPI